MSYNASGQFFLFASVVLAGLSCVPADAQSADPSLADVAQTQSVSARVSSEYAPMGIPLGASQVFLSANAKALYDDNVYNIDTQVLADAEFIFEPHASWEIKTPATEFTLSANSSIERYATLIQENANQYDLNAAGQWNIGQLVKLTAAGRIGRHHELRGTLGDIVVGAPSQYDIRGGELGLEVLLGSLVLTERTGLEKLTYLPVDLGGQTTSESYRNRTVYTVSGEASLPLSPSLRAFARSNFNAQDYQYTVNAIDQNSHGYDLTSGLAIGLDELLSGQLELGYLSQTYSDPSLGKVGGLTYKGRLTWNPTTLITATLSGGRTLQQSPFYAEGGVLEDNAAAQIDYWILKRLVINLKEGVIFDDYRGIDRSDRRYTSDIEMRYLFARRIDLSLQFDHRDQVSRGADARPYIGNTIMISASIRR